MILSRPVNAARQTEARHCRFRPAVHHPHFLDRRHPTADQFRHFHFERIRNSEAQSARRSIANRFDHDFRRVTENRRAPAPDVIDVFVSIDIPNPRAVRALNEKRLTADIAKCAHRRINAAGNAFLRAREKFAKNANSWIIKSLKLNVNVRSAQRPTPNSANYQRLRHVDTPLARYAQFSQMAG